MCDIISQFQMRRSLFYRTFVLLHIRFLQFPQIIHTILGLTRKLSSHIIIPRWRRFSDTV